MDTKPLTETRTFRKGSDFFLRTGPNPVQTLGCVVVGLETRKKSSEIFPQNNAYQGSHRRIWEGSKTSENVYTVWPTFMSCQGASAKRKLAPLQLNAVPLRRISKATYVHLILELIPVQNLVPQLNPVSQALYGVLL